MEFNHNSYEGMITDEEFEFLSQQASEVGNGTIVEIGSWRGKSAIALFRGIADRPAENRPMIFCVDPHAIFTGIYGGKFGAQDRKGFYEAMLRSGAWEDVRLINLKSQDAARGFPHGIDLIFIDGDHSEAGVRSDVEAWFPLLKPHAKILFDDATDQNIGPYVMIAELIRGGNFELVKTIGKITLIQKKG